MKATRALLFSILSIAMCSPLPAQWLCIPDTKIPDTDLLEFVCNENNKDLPHLNAK